MLRNTVYFLIILALGGKGFAASPPSFEYDRSTKNRAGLKASDICLSCRFYQEGRSAEEAVRAWRPTRLEWSYITDPKFSSMVRQAGAVFVGALNTISDPGPDQDGELLDGSRMVAPWMTGFDNGKGRGWACVNKPAVLPTRIKRWNDFAAQGVGAIQYDDWKHNLNGLVWGGCFCSACQAGFKEYLKEHASAEELRAAGVAPWEGFDYRDYLKKKFGWTTPREFVLGRARDPLIGHWRMFLITSTRTFFEKLLAAGEAAAGRKIPFTVNATMQSLPDMFLLDRVDYFVGETAIGDEQKLKSLAGMMKLADALNLPQIASPKPEGQVDVAHVRRAIALTYALGHRMLIPWDVYTGSGTPRWFATPQDYGAIYNFIREHADLLDGYQPWPPQLVITVPLTSDRKTGAATQQALSELAWKLMRYGYTFRVAAFGRVGELVYVPVNMNDFRGARAALAVGGKPSTADAPTLQAALGQNKLKSYSATLANGDGMAMIDMPRFRSNAKDMLVLPRVKPGHLKAPIALHLINLGMDSKPAALELAVGLSPSRATLLRPGKAPAILTFKTVRNWLVIDTPAIEEWGIVKLDCQ